MTLHGKVPQDIADLPKPHSSSSLGALGSSGQRSLLVPCAQFKTRGDQVIQAVAPRLCKSLCTLQSPLTLKSG